MLTRSGDGVGDGAPPRVPVKRRFTSGRECWVFSVPSPDDLPGHHSELIASALEPGEPVNYLLYAPLYEAQGGPFGLGGGSGSHALAATATRFLVSCDPHHDGAARSVRSIPFDRVLWIELGEALVLGWLVVRFSEAGRLQSETVFFQASGRHHFETAVRALRSRHPGARLEKGSAATGWLTVEDASPPYLRNELPGLVLAHERPLLVLRSTERWGPEEGRRRKSHRCLSPPAVAALSDRALFFVESERPSEPGGLVFGVNAIVVERSSMHESRVESNIVGDATLSRTALVEYLARTMAEEWRFVSLDGGRTPGQLCRDLGGALFARANASSVSTLRYRQARDWIASRPPTDPRQHVIVLDDVAGVSAAKLDLLRRLVRVGRFRLVAVAEAFIPAIEMAQLRSALVAREPIRLGPLRLRDAERFFEEYRATLGLQWSKTDIHGLAVAAHGFPLGMRELVARELRRGNTVVDPPVGAHQLDTRKELTP